MLNTAIYSTALIILSTKTENLGIFSVYIIVSRNLEIKRSFKNICWLYFSRNVHTCSKQIDDLLMAWSSVIHTLQ